MPALTPTSLTIKGSTGDAYIVGIAFYSDDATKVTVTCPTDPRWEAGGIMKANLGQGVTCQGANSEIWLPTKVPVRQGASLVITSTTGTGESYCLVYVDYPQWGEPFKIREPVISQPNAFLITKSITSGSACVAFTINFNSVGVTTFQRGRSYTPVCIEGLNAAVTGPGVFVGIANTKYNLNTFWNVALTPIKTGGDYTSVLPYGVGTVDGGETEYFHFLSTTTDTPVVNVTYAYTV